MNPTTPTKQPLEVRLRHPLEADHTPIADVSNEWWGGRRIREQLPRFWFRDFTGTSWLAETVDGRLAGFLIGFLSPDHPDEARIHLVGTDPNVRRRGVGRTMVERFLTEASGRGAKRSSAVAEAGDPVAIEFFEHLGFRPFDGPGTKPLYGVPGFEDYDGPGQDRVLLLREL